MATKPGTANLRIDNHIGHASNRFCGSWFITNLYQQERLIIFGVQCMAVRFLANLSQNHRFTDGGKTAKKRPTPHKLSTGSAKVGILEYVRVFQFENFAPRKYAPPSPLPCNCTVTTDTVLYILNQQSENERQQNEIGPTKGILRLSKGIKWNSYNPELHRGHKYIP